MATGGFIQLPNEVFKDLEREPVKLAAFCWLVANRDFETGELRHGIRAVAGRFDKSHSWARAVLTYTLANMPVSKIPENIARNEHKNGTERAQKWHAQTSPPLGPADSNGTEKARGGHGDGTARDTLQEEEVKEDTRTLQPPSPAKPVGVYSEDFTKFWKAYPNRTGKGAAWNAWKKQRPILGGVLEALSWQTNLEQWAKDGGQFIPHPSTYLNQRRWEDEKPAGQERQSTMTEAEITEYLR